MVHNLAVEAEKSRLAATGQISKVPGKHVAKLSLAFDRVSLACAMKLGFSNCKGTFRMSKYLLVAALSVAGILTVFNRDAYAADLPPEIRVGQHRLALNGWGARTKTFLELYVAGLYLTRPSQDSTAIVAANEPMAIRIKITSSFVSQSKLASSLEEGFRNSTQGKVAPIQQEIDRFQNCLQEDIAKGDVFDLVYMPEHGTIVNKNGKFKGVVAGVAFKKALFGIWLSANPSDASLKQAMLTQRTAQ